MCLCPPDKELFLMSSMKYFPRTRIELQPLETSLANARTELGRLSLDVTNKQRQLEEVQAKLDRSTHVGPELLSSVRVKYVQFLHF